MIADDANPTQQHRKAIAERLDLTEEQVQVRAVCPCPMSACLMPLSQGAGARSVVRMQATAAAQNRAATGSA